MRKTIMVLIVLMIVPTLFTGGDRAAGAQASYCATAAEAEMLRLINNFRQDNGLAPLVLSQPLGTAAEAMASDMAERDYVSHVSPDGQGQRQLLQSVGYTYGTQIGETIAAGNQSAGATFEQWLSSDKHRAIMLGGQFSAIGIGRAHNPDATYGWYWAAEFGGEVGTPADVCGSNEPSTDALVAAIIAILLDILAG